MGVRRQRLEVRPTSTGIWFDEKKPVVYIYE